ncbi:MAG: hypothetical protein ACE5F4_01345 [Candidatus Paceibacteria bacterium]
MSPERKETEEVRPADALGRLSKRIESSRITALIVGVILLFAVVFLGGLLFRVGTDGGNIPDIPKVEI